MGRGFKEPAISVQAAIFLDPNAEVVQVDAFGGDEVTFPVESVERDAQEGIPSYHVCIIKRSFTEVLCLPTKMHISVDYVRIYTVAMVER